ncbi:MAG: TIGR00730 family Rossman fold protein [Acidimicrobiales bacterium]
MAERLPRYRTKNREVDQRLVDLLDAVGASVNRDQLFEILVTAVRLATDETDRLDLKITNAALKELRYAFKVFAPYRHIPKVTMFGSARTLPDDPLYAQARSMAARMAKEGWMVVTGAGPGIMAAGLEGAGRAMSFGINIRLPFEQGANPYIAADPKLIEMKYFFTRKLALMKESAAFVVLPGGFGTLDELLELLTLLQTGKAEPAPIVCLEVPGGNYWAGWERFIADEVEPRGLISPEDDCLVYVTDDVTAALDHVQTFYRNYHSIRYVGDLLVIRLHAAPTEAEIDELSARFADICVEGGIEATEALPPEVGDDDVPDLPRICLQFDRMHHGRLRQLIDALNQLATAPTEPHRPPDAHDPSAAGLGV